MTKPKKKPPHRPPLYSAKVFCDVLNSLAMVERLNAAAAENKLHPSTLGVWLTKSKQGDPAFVVKWMDRTAPFHEHVRMARELSKTALDNNARHNAIYGHTEPRWGKDGKPIWKVDAKIASDALTLDQFDWEMEHGNRKREDVFVRDAAGALVQDEIKHPPNPQLLNNALAKMLPDQWGDKTKIEVAGTVGHVWIEGQSPKVIEQQPDPLGLSDGAEEIKRPDNTLALPAPATSSAEFDSRYMRKLLREVVIFRDPGGKVEPPLHDDVVIEGSWQHKAFVESGIEVKTHKAEALIAEGYQNDFLFALCPAAAYAKPTKETLYADAPGDSELVRDMKARAREGVKNPLPRDARGNPTVPNLRPPRDANDPPERITGANDGTAQRVGEGREMLGAGHVAPGGYSATPGRGKPRGFIR